MADRLTAGLGRLKLASGIFYGLLPASCLPSCEVVVASRKNVVSAGDVRQGYGLLDSGTMRLPALLKITSEITKLRLGGMCRVIRLD
jgi:hypothetical protein